MENLNHVAIIMDGNGRWAQSRSHRRIWGHVRGASQVSNIIETADDLGVKALTLYTFSSENWCRPLSEIQVLFKLLRKFLKKERKKLIDHNVRFRVIGEIEGLDEDIKDLIVELTETTSDHTGLKLNFAFGYGSRSEILNAVNQAIKSNPGSEISAADIENNLWTADCGDVDLLIRTGGNKRVSNFLLWQCAYAELFFTPTHWPEFGVKEFSNILLEVQSRQRRFGSLGESNNLDDTQEKAYVHKKLYQDQFDLYPEKRI